MKRILFATAAMTWGTMGYHKVADLSGIEGNIIAPAMLALGFFIGLAIHERADT